MTEGKDKKILIATSGIIIALAYVLKNLRRRKAPLYILKNGKTEVHVSGMGGIIQRLLVPDKDGKIDDIVLGHDTLDDYLVQMPHAHSTSSTKSLSDIAHLECDSRSIRQLCDCAYDCRNSISTLEQSLAELPTGQHMAFLWQMERNTR